LERAFELGGRQANWGGSSDLAYAYVKAGKPGDARRLLDELLRPGKGNYVPPTRVAGIYAVLDEKEKALEWLERAYEQRSGYLVSIKNDFVFENIWNEPRFLALLKKINLG
jgi:Flp pilus assembly protein TadD